MKKIFASALMLVLIPMLLHARIGDWETLMSSKQIRQFIVADSILWCASNGGVVRLNTALQRFSKYTNTRGLGSNDVTAIERDRQGNIWAAHADGRISKLDYKSDTWQIISDYRGLVVNDLHAVGDSLLVVLNIGVSLYDIVKKEVKETYRIGNSQKLIISEREMWVATREGVKKASLDFPNLMAPSAWTTFRIGQGLPSDAVLDVFSFGGKIYAGTEAGMAYFDGTSFTGKRYTDTRVTSFTVWEGNLIAALGYGIYKLDESGWSRLGPVVRNITQALADPSGELWLAASDNGLYKLAQDKASWVNLIPDGPSSNKISGLAIDQDGFLWTSSSDGGVSCYDGKKWRLFTKENGTLPSNDYRDIKVDQKNRIWAASWGGGVAIFEKVTRDSIKISFINSSDNILAGIQGAPNYVVVPQIFLDDRGMVWLVNYLANNQRVLAAIDDQGSWAYFSTIDGIRSDQVISLAKDASGRIWVGTSNAGVTVVDFNNTLTNKGDDNLQQGLSREDGLQSNQINSLAMDQDGVMWIGTPEGLNYWFGGQVSVRYNIINDNINCIFVDVRNNKWFGTGGGISLLDSDGFRWTHYTTSNSLLVSDFVTAIAFNNRTGDVYFGTTNGLSRLETPFTKPANSLAFVSGSPNPFILDRPEVRFNIDNLTDKVSVKIYTPEGHLIKTIPQDQIPGSRAEWDGTNDRGERVASGVYIFFVTTEAGQSFVGKVAVIRP